MKINVKDYVRLQTRKFPNVRYCLATLKRHLTQKNSVNHYLSDTRRVLNNIELDVLPKKQAHPQGTLIEITNACNLNCLMCNTKLSKRVLGLMSPEVFRRIIEELKTIGISSGGLHTVGETFVYKDLETLLAIAEELDFRVWISTNAQFPERIEPLYSRFPKVFNDIRISIDGATRETFERIRVGGSFDKVFETLEVIHKINCEKINSRIGVTIDSVLNLDTLGESLHFFKTFKKYVFPESINFGVITGLSPDDEYFKSTFPFKNLIRPTVPCYMPFTNQYFTFDGQVTMCCRDYNGEITVGDIMDESAMEIWDGPHAEVVRQQHIHPETLEIKACKNCFMPYDFVNPITNNFIHLVRIKLDKPLTFLNFANAVLALWEGMDEAMGKRDIFALRKFVARIFQEVDSGRFSFFCENNLKNSPKSMNQ